MVVIKIGEPTDNHEGLLDYKFKPKAPLKAYIEIKRKKSQQFYTLREVIFMWCI